MDNNKLGCSVFERPLVPETLPVFLLVDRGDCYFIEKVPPALLQPARPCTCTPAMQLSVCAALLAPEPCTEPFQREPSLGVV